MQPGAPTTEVESQLSSSKIELPIDYWALMKFANGSEGYVGDSYLRFYPVDQIIPLNRAFGSQEFIPGRLIFGSNGGGERSGPGSCVVEARVLSSSAPLPFKGVIRRLRPREAQRLFAQ